MSYNREVADAVDWRCGHAPQITPASKSGKHAALGFRVGFAA